jgi:hypothetical protein
MANQSTAEDGLIDRRILGTPGLSDEERIAILGGNAEKLLAVKPT